MSAAAQIVEIEPGLTMEIGPGFHAATESARLAGEIEPTKVEQLSPLWFYLRQGRQTGSKLPKILGLEGAFGDAESVMRDMVREHHGLPNDFVGNIATRYGTENEPIARRRAEEELEDAITECGIFIHGAYPWLAESPDGIRLSNGRPVQIKCPFKLRNSTSPAFQKAAELPAYWAQMQLSAEVTDSDGCEFIQWNPYGLSIEFVPRDEAWFRDVLPRLVEFQQQFLEIIASPELSAPYLKDLSVERTDDEWEQAAAVFRRAKQLEEEAVAATKQAKARLLELADHRTTKGGGVLVKRFEKKGNIDWKKVQAEHGEELAGIDLESYRGKAIEQTTVTVEKPKKGEAA